jgi:hypothetical protein
MDTGVGVGVSARIGSVYVSPRVPAPPAPFLTCTRLPNRRATRFRAGSSPTGWSGACSGPRWRARIAGEEEEGVSDGAAFPPPPCSSTGAALVAGMVSGLTGAGRCGGVRLSQGKRSLVREGAPARTPAERSEDEY